MRGKVPPRGGREATGLRYRDGDVSIGSSPQGLVATPSGIFVATRSLGVFLFVGDGDDYEWKQIVLEDKSESKLETADPTGG